jgi:hypothetical protein
MSNHAKYWRARAQEALALAEQMRDPEARRIMMEIAAGYERLAARAHARNAEKESK